MSDNVSADVAIEELLGLECKGCGGAKKRGMSHCRKCYFSLPKSLRSALYQRIGEGYERAYSESLVILRRAHKETH